MYTKDLTLEDRISNILIPVLNDTIKTQNKNMLLAEAKSSKYGDIQYDLDYLKAYELKSFAEQIKSIIDGSYDLTV